MTDMQLRDTFANAESRMTRTVGVVDMNDSTAMKEKEPEATWLNSLGWFYDVATTIIMDDIPGVVIKYVGDGVMFACETDYTTAAVNAVIKIQEAVKDAGTGSNGAKGRIDFTCSSALTTGEVRGFTTPVGTPDFVGSVVDKAFRLCGVANAKAIFVDTATVGAANAMNITSRFGTVVRRQSDEYTGDAVKTTLKGFAQPVAYHEILWDQQRYSVAPQQVTDLIRSAPPNTPRPDTVTPPGRPERYHGVITHWNSERKCGVVRNPRTSEDFYLSTRLMVYPEDQTKLTDGTGVAFVAVGTAEGNRKREAGATLLSGEPGEGPLVSRPPNRSHGWIRVQDAVGNQHYIYVPPNELANYQVNELLSFTVLISDRGASATDVERADDEVA